MVHVKFELRLFSLDELSEKAREKAIEEHRRFMLDTMTPEDYTSGDPEYDTPEAFRLSYCAPYIDNTRAHAEKILAEFAELKKARDEYRAKISAFNDLLPSGIGHANEREPKNYLI